jgi:hypothetical protein
MDGYRPLHAHGKGVFETSTTRQTMEEWSFTIMGNNLRGGTHG